MQSATEISRNIHRSASALLSRTSLIEFLSKYGKVELTGSFAYDLMIDPDIDILVRCEQLRMNAVSAFQELIDEAQFARFDFGDFVQYPRPGRPNGYIVALKVPQSDLMWEVEIWFVEPSFESNNDLRQRLETVDPHKRERILKIKHERQTRKLDKHQLSSTEIYEGVLLKGFGTIEEFLPSK